jgi:hypothetical protein
MRGEGAVPRTGRCILRAVSSLFRSDSSNRDIVRSPQHGNLFRSSLDFRRIHITASHTQRKETIEMKSPRRVVTGLVTGVLAGLLFVGAASALEVGQKAPDFTLNGTDGKPVKLSDLTAKGPVVLYTFIAAFTGT